MEEVGERYSRRKQRASIRREYRLDGLHAAFCCRLVADLYTWMRLEYPGSHVDAWYHGILLVTSGSSEEAVCAEVSSRILARRTRLFHLSLFRVPRGFTQDPSTDRAHHRHCQVDPKTQGMLEVWADSALLADSVEAKLRHTCKRHFKGLAMQLTWHCTPSTCPERAQATRVLKALGIDKRHGLRYPSAAARQALVPSSNSTQFLGTCRSLPWVFCGIGYGC